MTFPVTHVGSIPRPGRGGVPPLRRRERRAERGFTLIELTISAALMAVILGAAYACLNAGVAAQRLIDPRVDAVQSARVALALMTADLRAACPLDRTTEFVGIDRRIGDQEADNIDFGTLNHTPARVGEGDFCQTSYFLEKDPDPDVDTLVLWRRRNPRIGVDPFVGGERQEIARGVRMLQFEFYDGFDWYESWGDPERREKREASNRIEPNLSGFPTAIRITLAIAAERRRARASTDDPYATPAERGNPEPPLVFQTVARPSMPASAFQRVGSGSPGTAPGGTPGSNPGQPGAGGPGMPAGFTPN